MMPLPVSPLPNGYQDVLQQLQQKTLQAFRTGEYEPFVYPYRALSTNLMILYLLIPPINSSLVYYLRYPLFVFIVYHAVEVILQCRSPTVTIGYGIGLLNSWMIIWAASLLIFNDARSQFRRIEEDRQRGADNSQRSSGEVGDLNNVRKIDYNAETLRNRHQIRSSDRQEKESKTDLTSSAGEKTSYHWQTLPEDAVHRLEWVADLVFSLRGPRWSYQISVLTSPPKYIQSHLEHQPFVEPTPYSYITRKQLLHRNLPQFLLCLIALDVLKTTIMQDPYFWSLGPSAPSPFPYPRITRTYLTAASVYVSLQTIFTLSPLVYACALGPKVIGQHAWPWLYTPFFGSPRVIARKGLAGVWGQFWQQLFRFGFEQTGEAAARFIGAGWEKKAKKGNMLRVLVAFACSAFVHVCGSYTTMSETRPIREPLVFFMLQPVGLLGQRAISGWLRNNGCRERIPGWVREIGNVVFVVVWFSFTGPWIADDFTRAGIWLYEPLPFSLFRGLRGEGWWFWGGTWVRWHSASKWWQSGIAF